MKEMKLMLLVLLVAVAGCKSSDNSLTLLRAKEWQLKSMTENGKVVKNPQQIPTLVFSDSSAVFGSAVCNRFFGTYDVGEKGKMTFKTRGATMMFCPDMPFEDANLKALNKVEQYTVTDQELQLKGKDQLLIVYVPVDTTQRIGVAEDDHGCNAAAGYTWSEVKQNCIRLFEDGVQLVSETDKSSSSAAYVVFAADSLKAEVYVPGHDNHPVLDRRTLPAGGYVWNQEDDDTYNVRRLDGKWLIEQRGKVL